MEAKEGLARNWTFPTMELAVIWGWKFNSDIRRLRRNPNSKYW